MTTAPPTTSPAALEEHRRELTGYCYRMLGSPFEAEDAVQETMIRALRGLDRFEGRSQLRSWLYSIATNVSLDMLKGRQRRALPMDFGPAGSAEGPLGSEHPEDTWITPMPDARVLPEDGDPAEIAASRETLKLAFMAALQHLPPKQRAVLILREVLRWRASEVAELLGTSVPSVNSALQRARATLDAMDIAPDEPGDAGLPAGDEDLLGRYLDAFERYDMDALTALLTEDATLSMPPFPLWMRGPESIRDWMLGHGSGCRGSKLLATSANGLPAFGQYHPNSEGKHEAWSLTVLETAGGKVTGIHTYLDIGELFPLFGLPPRL